eukprot:SAG22_NODE_5866_length_939_cov_1.414286_1_plen_73_part_00
MNDGGDVLAMCSARKVVAFCARTCIAVPRWKNCSDKFRQHMQQFTQWEEGTGWKIDSSKQKTMLSRRWSDRC